MKTMSEKPEQMPDNATDRPLVTFALFAYNQEKYIREAVKGAFSQTYEPLEIILSDDCSSDRTFEIMQEMAKAYQGPHRVVARTNRKNLRTYSHVLEAVKGAKGDIVVLAAGDDISKPNRTSQIYEASRWSSAWAFHSRFDRIDESGKVLSTSLRSGGLFSKYSKFNKYFRKADGHVFVVHGATSAYKRELLNLAPKIDRGILSEDGVFTLLLNMKRKQAFFIEESLVEYRAHPEAISNSRFDREKATVSACQKVLEKQALYAKNIADRTILALDFSDYTTEDLRPLNESYMKDEVIVQQARYNWQRLGLLERLRAIRVAVRRRKIGYLIPSILGTKLGPRYLYIRYKIAK
jgi:glycosyltransferase involved in cell wall biosynthesis